MKSSSRLATLAALALLVAVCVGCSSNGNEQAEINALPKDHAATPNPPAGGGTVQGSPAEFLGQQKRPDGK